MARNGSGAYSLPAGNPVVTGTTISSTVQNNTMTDIGTALTQSIAYDGQTNPVANLPMAGFRHTGVANAAARTDYASAGQVQDGSLIWAGTAGGTANALTLTLSPAIAAIKAGQRFVFKSGASPNSAATTVVISGLAAISVQVNSAACTGGEIAANLHYEIVVDASLTSCQLNKIGKATPDELGLNVNYFVNGGCQVAQLSSVALSTTAQYGAVDNVMAWCSTGAVSAGTISQNTASGIGTTGNSLKLSGVTLTGSAVLSVRIRIESKDAVKLKNIASSVAALVSHDVGAPVNYTVIVRKPTVADNYASTTVISTSSATSVPTGISSATWLKSENIAMGDCSLGIEVEFQIACGAITTKNFEFTEFQIGRGATAVAIPLANYDDTFRRCQRYRFFISSADNAFASFGMGIYGTTTSGYARVQFPVTMFVPPTLVSNSAASTFGATGISLRTAMVYGATVSLTGLAPASTVGFVLDMQANNTTSAFLLFTAYL